MSKRGTERECVSERYRKRENVSEKERECVRERERMCQRKRQNVSEKDIGIKKVRDR